MAKFKVEFMNGDEEVVDAKQFLLDKGGKWFTFYADDGTVTRMVKAKTVHQIERLDD